MAAIEAKAGKAKPFRVWPANWPLFELFVSMGTQLRMSGGMQSEVIGLDYAVLPIVAAPLGIAIDRRTFGLVREMEQVALEEFRRQSREAAERAERSK